MREYGLTFLFVLLVNKSKIWDCTFVCVVAMFVCMSIRLCVCVCVCVYGTKDIKLHLSIKDVSVGWNK